MNEGGIKIGLKPSHPGDFLRTEVVDEFGLNVAEAADILGVDEGDLADLLDGKCALSPEMALRFEKAFAVGMEPDAQVAGVV